MGLDISTIVLGFVIFLPLSDSSDATVSDLQFVIPCGKHMLRLQRKQEIQLLHNLYTNYFFSTFCVGIQTTQ